MKNIIQELILLQDYLNTHTPAPNNQLNSTFNDNSNNNNQTIFKTVHDDFERLPRLELPDLVVNLRNGNRFAVFSVLQ